jgi:hypothetical protein
LVARRPGPRTEPPSHPTATGGAHAAVCRYPGPALPNRGPRSSKRNAIMHTCSGAPSARVRSSASSSTPDSCVLQLIHVLHEGARNHSVKKAIVNAGMWGAFDPGYFASKLPQIKIKPVERIGHRSITERVDSCHRLSVGYRQCRQYHHRTALASLATPVNSCG